MEERIGANGMPIPAKPAAEKAPDIVMKSTTPWGEGHLQTQQMFSLPPRLPPSVLVQQEGQRSIIRPTLNSKANVHRYV